MTDLELRHFNARREFTALKWQELIDNVDLERANKMDTADVFESAAAYVTGSMARDEATAGSDLDLFIIQELPTADGSWLAPLTGPEQAHFLSAVDNCRRRADFRPFSQKGRYVSAHSFRTAVQEIGNAEDDFSNRFTARMLLLLNSRPLINEEGYDLARDLVIDTYWRQEPNPETPFFPVFLVNDIKRWWSVVLLNFEFHNPPVRASDVEEESTKRRAQRRVNNLKLRYARLLAAWTPIIEILGASNDDGLPRSGLKPILNRTPVERLKSIRTLGGHIAPIATDILEQYDEYLGLMDATKEKLMERVLADDWSTVKSNAYGFGRAVASLLEAVGEGKPLYRYVQI